MRVIGLIVTIVASASVLSVAAPAQAQCPGGDGTVPGQPAQTHAVGPFYVDDRDFLDADADDDAGGIWVYLESNDEPDLQRGGDGGVRSLSIELGVYPFGPWPFTPTPVGPVTLFPNAPGDAGGPYQEEPLAVADDCVEGAEPDTLLF